MREQLEETREQHNLSIVADSAVDRLKLCGHFLKLALSALRRGRVQLRFRAPRSEAQRRTLHDSVDS